MKKLTIGSCFSGIGGIELGLEWTGGFETRWQIENDKYAKMVLRKNFPTVVRFDDIRNVDCKTLEPVDIIVGGYPCQPFSVIGKRKGENDDRYLWRDLLRIICRIRPRYALLENVPGHLSLGFGRVLGDLAEVGYDAEWQVLSASAVGAPHVRKRIFILAYPKSEQGNWIFKPGIWGDFKSGIRWEAEPNVGRVADGISNQLHRLKCLGNAVVPQVSQKIGEMILNHENPLRQL